MEMKRQPAIVCALILVFVLSLLAAVGFVQARNHRRYYVFARTGDIGRDLIAKTNSEYLVELDSKTQKNLSELFAASTRVSMILMGDEPAPIGDGTACSRLILENAKGERLAMRIRQTSDWDGFKIVGCWLTAQETRTEQ